MFAPQHQMMKGKGEDEMKRWLTWTGVQSQVRNLSAGPLQLHQNHSTHTQALLIGSLGRRSAQTPQIDTAVEKVLRSWGGGGGGGGGGMNRDIYTILALLLYNSIKNQVLNDAYIDIITLLYLFLQYIVVKCGYI